MKPAAKLTKTNVSRLLSKDGHDKDRFSCSEVEGGVMVQYHSGFLTQGGRVIDLQDFSETLSKHFACSFVNTVRSFVGQEFNDIRLFVTAKTQG